MNRPALSVRSLLACLMLVCLFGAVTAPAWADGPTVTAVFGIGGRYRPGGWCPVTIKVRNPGADALDGQVQALSEADPNAGRYGRPAANTAGAALFSRPVSVPGGGAVQTQLYTQGLDPGAGSVTVQVADGRTRGDGRILAHGSSTPNGNSLPAVTGTPITDADLFLVGFGGDPGAFTSLNGRKMGLAHLPGLGAGTPSFPAGMATRQNAPQAGNAQVVSVLPADLPDRAVGYSGVDAFLLRGDAPLDALSEAQADALKDWVAGGGHLVVVCPGADPGPYAAPFFQGLLPATIRATGKGTLTLTPKPLPGVRTLAPALVTGPYGAGWVSVTTHDLAAAPLPPAFWAAALTTPRTLLGAATAHDAALAQSYYGYNNGGDSALLSSAVLRGPSLDAPGTWVIGLFLLGYLVVLVPVNYLILKRLDRRELAWATIPALVIVFAVGTFGVGYAAKGGSVFVNRAAIVETAAGQSEAGVRGALGLFSPRRTSYDLTLTGTGLVAALPPALPNRFGGGGDAQASGQTRLVQTPGGAALLDASVNMWAMRAFDFQSTTDLGGTIDVSASGNMLTVTNHTPHALTGCQVIRGGTAYPAGTLAPGGTAQVSLFSQSYVNPQQPGLPLPQMSPDMTGSDQSVTPRMQAALSDYARTLGQPDNGNAYYYNNQGISQPRAPFAPAPNEALLVGWSDDPALAGPAPRVDGKAVTVHSTTLVVIHLPLPASLAAQAMPPAAPAGFSVSPGFRPSLLFSFISPSSALYRQAVDARTLKITAKNLGKVVTVRGTFRGSSSGPGVPGMTIALSPQTGATAVLQGTTVRLPFASNSQLARPLMRASEFVAAGTLTYGPGGPQVVVTQPSHIRLVARGFVRTLPPSPLPPRAAFVSRQYGFNAIPQTAAVYRKAVDARTLAVTAGNANKTVMARGLVTGNGYAVSAGQMVVTLGSQTLLLMPVSLGEQFRMLAMMRREVVVTGPLTRRGNSPQIAITQPSQVLLVGGGPSSMVPPSGPLPGSAYAAAQFAHVPKSAPLYRQASTPQNFAAPTGAGKPFRVRGILTDLSGSVGQCRISLQTSIGNGPKVTILVTSPDQSALTAVNNLIGQEVVITGVVNASAGAGAASLVSQPGQIFVVDNSLNTASG